MMDVARIIAAFVWTMVAMWLLGSVGRTLFGHARPHDAPWMVPWFFAFHQIGYAGRWLLDWSHHPEPGGDFISSLGLQVLSIMLALCVIGQRLSLEGKRW